MYQYIYLSIQLYVCLYIYLSNVYVSICVCFCLSNVHASIYLSSCMSVYVYLLLSVCLQNAVNYQEYFLHPMLASICDTYAPTRQVCETGLPQQPIMHFDLSIYLFIIIRQLLMVSECQLRNVTKIFLKSVQVGDGLLSTPHFGRSGLLSIGRGWLIIHTSFRKGWLVIHTSFRQGWLIINTSFIQGWLIIHTSFRQGWLIIHTSLEQGWLIIYT